MNETDELIHLQIGDSEIVTTPGHPFFIYGKGFEYAGNLRAGDILVNVNGEQVVLEFIQHEILESPVKVYNFEVEDWHTYFVGENEIWVHNDCGEGQVVDDVEEGFKKWLNKGEANNKVYQGMQGDTAKYTGITKQKLSARLAQHNRGGKSFTSLDEIHGGLTRNQARAIEQYYIENGPNELNKINSISKSSEYYDAAMKWAKGYLGK